MSGPTRRFSSVSAFLASRETGGASCRLASRPCLSQLTSDPSEETLVQGVKKGVRGVGCCSLSGCMVTDSNETHEETLPFALAYNQGQGQKKLLAVGDEQGYLTIVDTCRQKLPERTTLPDPGSASAGPSARWIAHNNAVFDLCWNKNGHRIMTCSGDQSLTLWSTLYAQPVGYFLGHRGSVKAVCCQPMHDEIFASGSRDGVLAVWDSRVPAIGCSGQAPTYQPVASKKEAHKRQGGSQLGKRRSKLAGNTKDSVTSVAFLSDGHTLVSAGASDSVVKIWDMRNMKRSRSDVEMAPRAASRMALDLAGACPSPQQGTRQYGITSLTVHQGSNRLLASCSNHAHYLFDALRPDQGYISEFRGHKAGGFYIKADFSPCGTHFVSGSNDHNVYIWQVDRPQDGPYMFKGHEKEVTSVAWCPKDFLQLATCSDDSSVRVWSVKRTEGGQGQPRRLVPPAAKASTPAAQQAVAPELFAGAPKTPEVSTVRAREPLSPWNRALEICAVPGWQPAGLAGDAAINGTSSSTCAPKRRIDDVAAGEKENAEGLARDLLGSLHGASPSASSFKTPRPSSDGFAASSCPATPIDVCRRTVQATIPGYLFTPQAGHEGDGSHQHLEGQAARSAGRRQSVAGQRGQLSIANFLQIAPARRPDDGPSVARPGPSKAPRTG